MIISFYSNIYNAKKVRMSQGFYVCLGFALFYSKLPTYYRYLIEEVIVMIQDFDIEYHLYDLRIKANLTDRQLAALSGISKTQINQVESGKANPTIHTLCALALALNVSPCDLFSIRFTP